MKNLIVLFLLLTCSMFAQYYNGVVVNAGYVSTLVSANPDTVSRKVIGSTANDLSTLYVSNYKVTIIASDTTLMSNSASFPVKNTTVILPGIPFSVTYSYGSYKNLYIKRGTNVSSSVKYAFSIGGY